MHRRRFAWIDRTDCVHELGPLLGIADPKQAEHFELDPGIGAPDEHPKLGAVDDLLAARRAQRDDELALAQCRVPPSRAACQLFSAALIGTNTTAADAKSGSGMPSCIRPDTMRDLFAL